VLQSQRSKQQISKSFSSKYFALGLVHLTKQFGGIWLEIGEQATSPTPSTSHRHQIGNHQH
jgi:hypothetical protein